MNNLLFKPSGIVDKETNLGDTNFKSHYPSINQSVNWIEFQPYIRQAVDNFIIPFLGEDFYEVLVLDYDSENESNSFRTKLRTKLQDSIAYFSVFQSLPFINITISDAGVLQKQSENNTAAPLNQWRFKNSRNNAFKNAYGFLDQALAMMEKNIDDGFLATWVASDEFKNIRTEWFKTTSILNQFLPINNSRRNFAAFVPYLKQSESDLKEILCDEFYDEFFNKIKQESVLNSFETELARLCRYFLANMSMVKAIPNLRLQIGHEGFHVVQTTDNFDSKIPADDKQVSELKRNSFNQGSKYKDDIIKFLFRNIDSFETFKNSRGESIESEMVICSDDGIGGIFVTK